MFTLDNHNAIVPDLNQPCNSNAIDESSSLFDWGQCSSKALNLKLEGDSDTGLQKTKTSADGISHGNFNKLRWNRCQTLANIAKKK